MTSNHKIYWSPFFHDGLRVDLSHLEPFDFTCLENRRRVAVIFGQHTFTRGLESGDDPTKRCFDNRIFCPERYALSHNLPSVVSGLPGSKVYQTWEANAYVTIASVVLVGTENYHVFLTAKRDDLSKKVKRVRLTIESAYVDNASNYLSESKPHSIKFENLIENTFMGRPIVFHRNK